MTPDYQANSQHDALLDSFAAAALTGIYASNAGHSHSPEKAAELAYQAAKAMLAERTKHLRSGPARRVVSAMGARG